jgi:hypothetical protein
MITKHITDLLHHHECVIVPGLGGFIKAYCPAQIIKTTNEFYPPTGTVAFNAGLSVNDGTLANYIASVEECSYREAVYRIKIWVEASSISIKNGEKLVLEGIGTLFLNTSGKLEFEPSLQVNFNTDSFGLPVLFTRPARNEQPFVPEIQTKKHAKSNTRLHRLIPETIKWAAVLAPFVAFVLWGSINGNIIHNYVHNYTGMYSWVRSTPGKTVDAKPVRVPTQVQKTPATVLQSPASILADENIAFNPALESHSQLDKNKIKIIEPVHVADAEPVSGYQQYYIIGGAFRDHDNALRLISTLVEQGYPASVVDTTPSGLYVVGMIGFNLYDEAVNQLSEIKNAGFESAWILKKHKGL